MRLDAITQMFLTASCSLLASTGFWAWMSKKSTSDDAKTKLLLGLCHDRILCLGMSYIHRGYLTKDEYVNIIDYLSEPYFELGGNGAGHRIIDEVKGLPIKEYIIQKEGVL